MASLDFSFLDAILNDNEDDTNFGHVGSPSRDNVDIDEDSQLNRTNNHSEKDFSVSLTYTSKDNNSKINRDNKFGSAGMEEEESDVIDDYSSPSSYSKSESTYSPVTRNKEDIIGGIDTFVSPLPLVMESPSLKFVRVDSSFKVQASDSPTTSVVDDYDEDEERKGIRHSPDLRSSPPYNTEKKSKNTSNLVLGKESVDSAPSSLSPSSSSPTSSPSSYHLHNDSNENENNYPTPSNILPQPQPQSQSSSHPAADLVLLRKIVSSKLKGVVVASSSSSSSHSDGLDDVERKTNREKEKKKEKEKEKREMKSNVKKHQQKQPKGQALPHSSDHSKNNHKSPRLANLVTSNSSSTQTHKPPRNSMGRAGDEVRDECLEDGAEASGTTNEGTGSHEDDRRRKLEVIKQKTTKPHPTANPHAKSFKEKDGVVKTSPRNPPPTSSFTFVSV